MKEYPILFSTEMVRAIIDGPKTQTRRVITDRYLKPRDQFIDPLNDAIINALLVVCPYGKAGDQLWVREAFAGVHSVIYKADDWRGGNVKWKPGIHMPRSASRITLEIIRVRVERVQDISEDDAKAEGVFPWTTNTLRMSDPDAKGPLFRPAFTFLWDSINAQRGFGWDMNPYVWVIKFKRVAAEK